MEPKIWRSRRSPASVPSSRPGFAGSAVIGLAALALLLFLSTACAFPGDGRDELLVFAAASLRDVLTDVAELFDARTELHTVFNFAGSNVLALQIAAAPVADVYVAADEEWMDYLDQRDLLEPGSRRSFLANRLVVIAHVGSDAEIDELQDLAAIDFRHLSLADPLAVPAGRYAKSFLTRVTVDGGSLWERFESKVSPAADVRAALAMVEARRDALGVVYETDAKSSSGVRVLAIVPEPPAPSIDYSAAAIRRRSPRAADFLDYLESEEAGAVFEAHGFQRGPTHG